MPNFFRKPYGPGWALVGDAGYTKDPITAQGITNAFRDAELCAAALDAAFTGLESFDDAMANYQTTATPLDADVRVHHPDGHARATTARDAAAPRRDLGNQAAMDAFVSITAGTISPIEFFDPANLAPLMSGSGTTSVGAR